MLTKLINPAFTFTLESNDVNNELPALIDIFQCTSVLYHLVRPMPKYFAKGGLKSKCLSCFSEPITEHFQNRDQRFKKKIQ